jgi:hypothetical protein
VALVAYIPTHRDETAMDGAPGFCATNRELNTLACGALDY